MMKTGWWNVKFDLTLEGEEVCWEDLDECTQEHIAEMIKEGYNGGEIVIEEDNEEDIYCPLCGNKLWLEREDMAVCDECGWCNIDYDVELDELRNN